MEDVIARGHHTPGVRVLYKRHADNTLNIVQDTLRRFAVVVVRLVLQRNDIDEHHSTVTNSMNGVYITVSHALAMRYSAGLKS